MNPMSTKTTLALSALFAACFVGCSGTSQSEIDLRQLASKLYSEAKTAFDNKDFETAEEKYSAAIETGRIRLDLVVNTRIELAVAKTYLDKLSEAQKLLDEIEEYSSESPDLFHSARAFLFFKQGDKGKANAEWRKAKRINRKVVRFGQ